MTVAMYLTAGLFALAVLWKLYQLFQAPQDRPLQAVTFCLICTAGSFSLGLQPEAHALDAIAGTGAASLVSNALLLCCAYWLLAFYLYSAADRQMASRRVRLEAVPLAVAMVVMTLAIGATPVGVRGRPYGAADLHTSQVAVFFMAVQLYLVYAFATTARWTGRYARMSQRPLTTGLWLTAASLVGMAMADSFRVAMDLIGWHGDVVPGGLARAGALLFAFAVPAFVVGLSYSSVAMRLAGFRVWRQHRRTHRRLRPLWLLLHEAFPQDALNRAPTASVWREILHVHGVHRSYYRRVIECRDGLVRVSPYLVQQGIRDEAPPEAVASHLRSALRAQAAGEPVPTQALAVALPVEDSLNADARQLVALSDALGTHG